MQRTLIVGLLVAAAGFIAQMVAGVTDTPTIPPGLVAIVAAAALVAFTPWPSAPLVAVAAGVFNLGAFAVVGGLDRLIDASPLLAFVGAWLMVVGLIVSSLTGTIAVLNTHRGSGTRRVPAVMNRRQRRGFTASRTSQSSGAYARAARN